MEGNEIESYLAELGNELDQQLAKRNINAPLRMLVVGGSFMVLAVGSRPATEDIDYWLIDEPTDTFDTDNLTPELKAFKAAIWAVARKYHLKRKWANDVVVQFIKEMAPDPQPTHWKTFGKLQIYFPDDRYVLATKIATFREKDREDVDALLQKLAVTTRAEAQAIIDQFIPDKGWQDHYEIEMTLDELFFLELLE